MGCVNSNFDDCVCRLFDGFNNPEMGYDENGVCLCEDDVDPEAVCEAYEPNVIEDSCDIDYDDDFVPDDVSSVGWW